MVLSVALWLAETLAPWMGRVSHTIIPVLVFAIFAGVSVLVTFRWVGAL